MYSGAEKHINGPSSRMILWEPNVFIDLEHNVREVIYSELFELFELGYARVAKQIQQAMDVGL
tara:strand:- start:888 stop:1076 length:189 start_codon:yes stop_codon:yes gene_type:complete